MSDGMFSVGAGVVPENVESIDVVKSGTLVVVKSVTSAELPRVWPSPL